jgi:hypothetical protein
MLCRRRRRRQAVQRRDVQPADAGYHCDITLFRIGGRERGGRSSSGTKRAICSRGAEVLIGKGGPRGAQRCGQRHGGGGGEGARRACILCVSLVLGVARAVWSVVPAEQRHNTGTCVAIH